MFQHNGIARHQGGNDRVHRREIGIVPRRNGEHHAPWFTGDKAREAFLCGRRVRRQRAFRNGDHVPRPLFKATKFARPITDGTPHLPGKLRHDLVLHRQHGINSSGTIGGALLEGHALPLFLRRVGCRKSRRYVLLGSNAAACIELAINRGKTLDRFSHDPPQ